MLMLIQILCYLLPFGFVIDEFVLLEKNNHNKLLICCIIRSLIGYDDYEEFVSKVPLPPRYCIINVI